MSKFSEGDRWVLTENEFPYDLTPDIKHMILWIHPDTLMMNDDDVESILESLEGYKGYCFFRNKPNVRSVMSIDHYQVFLLKE
jgi:hypothetical protein